MSRTTPMFTADDLRKRPDDGTIYEVVSTGLVAREMPSKKHDRMVERLHAVLTAHADEGDLGAVFRWPWPVELSRYDVVRPDVAFVSWGRDGVITVDGVRGAPELIAEVVSPETRARDLGEKKRLYQWAKVFEYWIVDPDEKTFQAFTRTKFGLQPIPLDGTTFRSVLMPELSFDVSSLFR